MVVVDRCQSYLQLQNALQRLPHKKKNVHHFILLYYTLVITCVPCSLTVAQKVIRVDWFVDALKSRQVHVVRELLTNVTRLPSNVKIDNFEYQRLPSLVLSLRGKQPGNEARGCLF